MERVKSQSTQVPSSVRNEINVTKNLFFVITVQEFECSDFFPLYLMKVFVLSPQNVENSFKTGLARTNPTFFVTDSVTAATASSKLNCFLFNPLLHKKWTCPN